MNTTLRALALTALIFCLSPAAHAAPGGKEGKGQNVTADDFIRRIDERTTMVKQKMQERAGQAGKAGKVGPRGGRSGKVSERLDKRDQRIEQRLASSNLSEEEKERVRAKMQASRKELEAAAAQNRSQQQGGPEKRGRRKQSRQ